MVPAIRDTKANSCPCWPVACQIDYPMRVDGHDFTVADLVEYEKLTCRPKSELTFKLIGLAHYLDSDATWTSEMGREVGHSSTDPAKSWPSRSTAPAAAARTG